MNESLAGKKVNIKTYGCQQNVNDSERILGMLLSLSCVHTDDENDADIIIFNTCAVREHAEDKVLGHVGRLKALKEKNPELIIAIGGCMVEQPATAERIKNSFSFVDVLFNTNELKKLPVLLQNRLGGAGRVFASCAEADAGFEVEEGIPTEREKGYRAFVPVMYGCDNFCSYCIVPYVRGRERSRESAEIEKEVRYLVKAGCRDITLLGQNVNSYGKGLAKETDFSELLKKLDAIEGDYTLRFMTSHPKDATKKLFETIASSKHLSRHIHLPVQSGSDEILKKMNRRYSVEEYRSLIETARSLMPDVTFTSDIIIGFPGETEKDYLDTVKLIEEVKFYSLFIFIYSKRTGTAAALMEDDTPHELKAKRLMQLTEIQNRISEQYDEALIGSVRRCLAGPPTGNNVFEARLDNNAVVEVSGMCPEGSFCNVELTGCQRRRLHGALR